MNIILNKNIEVLESKDKLIIRNTKEGKELHLKNTTILKEILNHCTDFASLKSIHNSIEKSNVSQDELKDIIEFFEDKNILIKKHNDNKIGGRYSRQIEFWESLFSVEDGNTLQNTIENQHVVIIGAGGIGTWMSLFLTQIGVGKITLIDNDSIEDTNLARQVLFDENDIGKNKIDVLKKKLSFINSNVEIQTIKDIISKDNIILDEIKSSIDLVINCADNPNISTTSSWINEYCYPKNIVFLVGGGYTSHSSKIGTLIIPGETPCWECYIESTSEQFEYSEEKIIIKAAQKYKGTSNISCALTASIQTLDILKYLSGNISPYTKSLTADLDLKTLDLHYHYFTKKYKCRFCDKEDTHVKEI